MTLPTGHQTIMPYLMLDGGLKFIEFTQTVFDAKVNLSMHQMHSDFEKVRHSEIQIGGSTIMFTDTTEQWKAQPANLFIYVENADATYQKALDAGATSVMGLSDQNYGRTCGVQDPFGNVWWITSVGKK